MAESQSLSLGVDWSSGSWFAVAFAPTGFDHAAVFEEIGELWHRYEEAAERVFVDMPIGQIGRASCRERVYTKV